MKGPKKKWQFKLDKSDIFLWLGALAICGGVGMIYLPAGVIILGMYLVFISFTQIKPGKGG